MQLLAGNPFSTRWVRPGAIPFQFGNGESPKQLIDRLQSANGRGQIIGPHGAGKSTLLATLIEPLKQRGLSPVQISLHDGQRRLGVNLRELVQRLQGIVVVIDGYEQLGWWSRLRLLRVCQRYNWGLLATAHASVGLPTIYEVRTELKTVQHLASGLQPADECLVDDADVAVEFSRHDGNVRETLFGLYDLYGLRQMGSRRRIHGAS